MLLLVICLSHVTSPALAATQAAVTQTPYDHVAAHLRALKNMRADFIQTAPDGAVSRGTLLLARPGRLRVDYAPDTALLIIADGKRLWLIDYDVRQVSSWLIRETPLAALIDDKYDLARHGHITRAPTGFPAKAIGFQVADKDHPEYGVLTLVFLPDAAGPKGLIPLGWVVRDPQNKLTMVQLHKISFDPHIDRTSFSWRDPRPDAAVPWR